MYKVDICCQAFNFGCMTGLNMIRSLMKVTELLSLTQTVKGQFLNSKTKLNKESRQVILGFR